MGRVLVCSFSMIDAYLGDRFWLLGRLGTRVHGPGGCFEIAIAGLVSFLAGVAGGVRVAHAMLTAAICISAI